MDKREGTKVLKEGVSYSLAIYEVDKGLKDTGKNQQITFVSKDHEGVCHEGILVAMIEDLKYKNSLVPSKETAMSITNLQQALLWMEEREYQRSKRGVLGTDKK